MESFARPIVLIAGGQSKGENYATLKPLIAERVTTLIVLGEEASKLRDALEDDAAVKKANNMNDAVIKAAGAVRKGEIVLLSPGCASFDMYPNFEARGREFKACVKELAECRKVGNFLKR